MTSRFTLHASRSTLYAPRLAFLFLPCLSLSLYLGYSLATGQLGFPLDDAWIHQTYARNLAGSGQFAFVPGQLSAGSTSVLWTGLLALGYLLGADYRVWTYGLGALALGLNAWLTERLALTLWPERKAAALAAGAFVAVEWHLVWAAASGMETLLFAALALAAFVVPPRRAGWLGVCVGLSILARPDGLTLLPFVLGRIVSPGSPALTGQAPAGAAYPDSGLRDVLKYALGFGVVFVPYLAFNFGLGGSLWPNTFAAKQAEYAILRSAPLLLRLGQVGVLPLIGAQVLLLPGMAAAAWGWIRSRQWNAALALGWAIALSVIYAVRLPATYQHGRYVMPVIPVLVAVGLGGLSHVLRLHSRQVWPRLLSRAWAAAVGVLAVAFWLIGMQAYARDVRFIESEMVRTARWVNAHTEPDALVAAHDIGALGYFGGRELLDLAGLVSPEVIPFIRDEGRLRDWLNASRPDYLVTFPSWYPQLVAPLAQEMVYRTDTLYRSLEEGENMAVYRWLQRAR
jgi:hypothetical protein